MQSGCRRQSALTAHTRTRTSGGAGERTGGSHFPAVPAQHSRRFYRIAAANHVGGMGPGMRSTWSRRAKVGPSSAWILVETALGVRRRRSGRLAE